MKITNTYIITIILCIAIGFGICWFFFLRPTVVEKVIETKIVYVEKNAKEITDPPLMSSKMNYKYIFIDFKLNTTYYGLIHSKSKLSRQLYQYNNRINIVAGYFVKSQLVYVGLDYSYKNFIFGGMVGYNAQIKDIDYGINAGGGFSF